MCSLYSSIVKGLKYTPGKETGMKKTDYNLTLPEVSICVEENRQKRCKQEPKCQHVNCLRNALEHLLNEVVGGQGQNIEHRKLKTDMMLVLLRMNSAAIQVNASAHSSIKLLSVMRSFIKVLGYNFIQETLRYLQKLFIK